MLKRLFPKIHARYRTSARGALLGEFAAWLVSAGYARPAAHGHVRRLKQALEETSSVPLALESGISAGLCRKRLPRRASQGPISRDAAGV